MLARSGQNVNGDIAQHQNDRCGCVGRFEHGPLLAMLEAGLALRSAVDFLLVYKLLIIGLGICALMRLCR